MREILKQGNSMKIAAIFILIFVSSSFLSIYLKNGEKHIIHSDGRGYYAYLPAFICFQDPTFKKSLKAEQSYHEGLIDQVYVFQVDETHNVNKYFPGVSILILPFFLIACFLSYLFDLPIDGYNIVFQWGYWFASIFYTSLGILLWLKLIQRIGIKPQLINRVFLFICAGPTLFYLFFGAAYSHVFSFCLFALLGLVFFQFYHFPNTRKALFLGVILGLIFLVRPTNVSVVCILPLLLIPGKNSLVVFYQRLWSQKRFMFLVSVGFFLIFILFLVILYIQTGHFFEWSYKKEGFNWFRPKLDEWIWGYRTGILFHIPILILVLFLGFKRVKENSLWWFYIIYVIALFWILSAWWCWNYESGFNIRPLAEHMLFLYFPLFFQYKKWIKILINILLVITIIYMFIRLYQHQLDIIRDQRFTKKSYWGSLDLTAQQCDRWNATLAPVPFGNKIRVQDVLSVDLDSIRPNEEFNCVGEINLLSNRTSENNYVVVTCEKKRFENFVPSQLKLVMDAWNSKGTERNYQTIPFYEDKFEGDKDWVSLRFELTVQDNFQQFDKMKVYVWNPGKEKVILKNYNAKVEWYMAK